MCQHPVNMRKGIDSLFNLIISESQLKASNAMNDQLRLTIDNMSASMNSMAVTISELRETIANLESLLKERDKSLDKANNQLFLSLQRPLKR